MKKILLTSALCASIMFAQSAPSSNYSYEVTPFAAGILSDSQSNLANDNYANAGISLAKNLKESFLDQVELAIMRSDSLNYKGTTNGNTNINRVFLNAVKKLPLTEKLAAYGLVGAGYQDVTQEIKDHDDSALVNYGVGLRYDLPYYGVAVKGDVRHLFGFNDKSNDVMYTLGLAMPLGKKYSENIAAKVPVIEEPVAVVPVVDGDDDNDGVLNSKDLCPDSLPGAVVNENGCEIDDDNDGIVNRLDKCPNTSPDVQVNEDGCVATINLNIKFDTMSDKIKSRYNSKLQEFANLLNENTNLKATIEAHTDSRGSESYNQRLSEKRAASTVRSLEKLNILPSRLQSIGYGETQPIATNDTAEGRAENRRVTGLINQ
ncbi:hypothetical protein LPB137_03220 [Poseidonibacter parvus]|uniref:OmpA-like domain-containing protein n=1 Tax=Poseidonibacter parvus TaxID=1850254 RepID=A0A1P8KK66_9BACT|nr:OmpA family protein [Poseidonibacter parvus]APW64925.1 hypothetical protein LPB137_03220 [Poseidonibacter parvus]